MEGIPQLMRKFFIFFLLILSILHGLLVKEARSKVYTVGDDEGWDSGVDYGVWSQKYNFTTGDVLVFKYVKSQHNTYEVTESTFRSCDTSSGVLAIYESGNDQITLDEARKYWFICNVGGHCLGGMRFGIDVTTDSTNEPPSPQAQPLPPPPARGSGGDEGNGSSKLLFYYGPLGLSIGFCLVLIESFILR